METGDLLNEFKSAKPAEKVVIVIGVVGVAGLAFYLYKKGNAAAASTPAGGSSSSGQVAGYPTAGGAPVLPNGVNPVYDPNGNLVAFQNPPPTTSTTTTPTATTPANWYTNILGKLGYNSKISVGGYDVNGQRFWTGKNQFFYAPIGSTIQQGAQGRVWITPAGGTQHLLTGPGMTTSTTTVAKTASK